MTLVWLAAAAALYTAGGVFMKLSQGLTQPLPSLLLFVSVCLGAFIQALAMRPLPLGVTYLLILGLEAALALAGSVLIFREALPPLKVFGLVLVLGGVGCLQTGQV